MEPLALVIGNKNYSSWSLRPWVLLKYFQIPFREIIIPLKQPQSKSELLRYSPSGKVPVLLHGNFAVWDSLSIAEYLAELFKEKGLWPQGTQTCAWARSISCEMHSSFTALRTHYPMDVKARVANKPATRECLDDITRINAIWDSARKNYAGAGPFLFGTFSIADAMYAPVVFRFNTYGVKLNGPAQEYCQTILALPAMQEWQKQAALETYPWG